MRYFSALCARMYRFSANSRATISSTAIFFSQQSRQYFSSPRGSETSFAPQRAHRDLATALRGIPQIYHLTPDFDPPCECRRVHSLDVFLQHSARTEARRHRSNGFLNGRDPAVRSAIDVALVERRHDLLFQETIEGGGVGGIDRVVIVARL